MLCTIVAVVAVVAVAFYIQTEDILYITSVYMLYTVVAVIFIKVYINMYI